MLEARAITNLIGNVVATVTVVHWSDALDHDRARWTLDGEVAPAAEQETDTDDRRTEVAAPASV